MPKDEMITEEYQQEREERENNGLMENGTLKKKIFEIRNTIGKMSKDKENPFYHSQYFDINSLLDNLQSYLETNQLLLTQPIENGCLVSRIEDLETGETMESAIPLPSLDDPQKIGSAITYYRRYSLKSLLAISEEDDDGNKATKKKPESDGKKWLNATHKNGKPNDRGEKTAKAILAGKTTWDALYTTHKVSKKDKEAVNDYVADLRGDAGFNDDELPF